MHSKTYSIDRLSTATLRQAQNEMAIMQSDLRKLRDSISNMSRSIKEPVIKAKRSVTKRSVSSMSPLLLAEASIVGRLMGSALVDQMSDDQTNSSSDGSNNNGGSDTPNYLNRFYKSESQLAGNYLVKLILGQRIR
jgi:hypothetical protein